MNDNIKNLLYVYAGLSISDATIKVLKLNSIYLKAKKSAVNLKYKKDLMQCSKEDLKIPRYLHIVAAVSLCKYSLVPGYGFASTYNIFKDEENFIADYVDMMNYIYNEINENEELERQYVAEFLASVYNDFKDELPESYKGHKLSDSTIRISRKEMIKFLKKNKIVLEELPTEDKEYVDYTVRLLKK